MLFYFSGAGNSKQVAKAIATATGEELVNIADYKDVENPTFSVKEGERIGFACATHFWGLPYIVAEFVKKMNLTTSGNHYTYMVATCGTMCGGVIKHMKRLLERKGMTLDAEFSVRMVDTWTPMFDLSNQEENDRKTAAAITKIEKIASQIKDKTTGDHARGTLPAPLAKLFYMLYPKKRQTKHFRAEESCNGCGMCSRNCPEKAIEIAGNRPTWKKESCTLCLRCLHHCPNFAIQYGNSTKKHGQFVNKEGEK